MIRIDVIRMAGDAGLTAQQVQALMGPLERLVDLAQAAERSARQAAQAENEELKARLARAGVEQRKAVWRERMECAGIVRANAEACTSGLVRDVLLSNAAAINMHAIARGLPS